MSSDCELPTRATYDWRGRQLIALGTFGPGGQTYGDLQVSTPNPVWVMGVRRSTQPHNLVKVLGFCAYLASEEPSHFSFASAPCAAASHPSQ